MNIEVLGNVQDGGVPHLGCKCEVCSKARENGKEKSISSLLLKEKNNNSQACYLIDATPDLRYQFEGDYLDGIFLTNDGLGHMTGLLYLGKESYDYSGIPVYTTENTHDFLQKNDPYRFLIDRGNIEIEEVEDGDEQKVQGGKVEMIEVEHPHVETDNMCFMIHGDEEKVLYIPDIHKWTPDTEELVKKADIAIIDGTFWSDDEIDRYDEVPHPTVQESMELFEDADTDIYFTHLNHTNPILKEGSDERKEIEEKGFQIVEKGMEFNI